MPSSNIPFQPAGGEQPAGRLHEALGHLAQARDNLMARNIGGGLEAAQREVIEAIRIVNEERWSPAVGPVSDGLTAEQARRCLEAIYGDLAYRGLPRPSPRDPLTTKLRRLAEGDSEQPADVSSPGEKNSDTTTPGSGDG